MECLTEERRRKKDLDSLQTFEANKKFDPYPKKVLIITSFDPIGKQAHPITPKANRKVTLAVNNKRNDIFA